MRFTDGARWVRRAGHAAVRQHGARLASALLAAGLLFGLGGCSSLPMLERSGLQSQAIPASPANPLARAASVGQPAPDASGFRLLPLGSLALDARLQLVRRAQASLDVQYYHFANDGTGQTLLRGLRDAAARGVRVRLLLDDLYTGGMDELLSSFAAHPGVEVRVYNPFTAARGHGLSARFAASPMSWGRLNHRMHNKLFVADGALAVIGGRNVADEYYLRKDADNFIDVDALVSGAVLPAMQELFDRYWNSELVFPIDTLAPQSIQRSARQVSFEAATRGAVPAMPQALPASDVLGRPAIGAELDRGVLSMIWGAAYVFADHPDKPLDGAAGGELLETSVTYNVLEVVRKAEQDVVVSSPYFIPGRRGLTLFADLRRRGVRVSVLTNSLGSTDELLAHLGYSRYRQPLLTMGVDLYELSSRRVRDNMRMFLFAKSLGRLHAKSLIVDGRISYIGSMNLDPRSATINTEFGAVVDSPALAAELARLIEIDRLHSAYRVLLDAQGLCCEWHLPDGDGMRVMTLEPDSAWWMRWLGSALEPITPEDHL